MRIPAMAGWRAGVAGFLPVAAMMVVAVLASTVAAQGTISTFPYQPSPSTMSSDFSVNSGSGPTAAGSSWSHGTLSGNRKGKSGTGCDSWACQPASPYNATTVSWLDSPTFDISGQGSMVAEFYLWVRAKQDRHGLKLMVSTDGGSSWSDCPTTLAYNGNTSNGNALSNAFGGSDNCWTHNTHGGSSAKRVQVSLIPYRHCSALKFRWCFASNGNGNEDGPVIDSFMLMSMGTVSPELYQGTTENITISGSGFTGVDEITPSLGVTVNNWNFVNDSQITANVTVSHLAHAGPHEWEVLVIVGGFSEVIPVAAHIVWPTDILPTTHDGEPSRNPAVGGVNVFLANGEFFKAETDLATRGRMMGINWSRFYASRSAYNGPLGQMWMGHYFQRAIRDGTSQDITWYTPDLRTEVFTWNSGSSSYDSPAGVYVEAEYDSGTITLTDRHGFVCEFNADGRLVMCTDRNGNSTTCTYNADGQLTIVTDDRGFEYEIEYYSHGRVQYVKDYVWDDSEPREVEYGYNSDGQLTSQKAPETDRYKDDTTNNRTEYQYTYDANHRMLTCKNPREVTGSGAPYLTNTYENGRVVQQQLGTTGQNIYLRYCSSTLVHEVDRRGVRTDYTLDGSGRATAVERFNHFWEVDTGSPINHCTITKTSSTDVRSNSGDLSWETTLAYNSNHEVTEVVMPRGNSVEYTYQSTGGHLASGNLTEIRRKDNALGSLSDIVESYTYESNFNFVKTHTDPRGNVTTYTYDYEETTPVTTAGNLVEVESETVNAYTAAFTGTTYEVTTTATYNAFGQITSVTDGEGNVTSFVYYDSGDPDQEGFLKHRIVADGDLDLKTEYEYNRAGFTVATWGPRAFESGATKDNFKVSYTVNELGQTTHVQGRRLRATGTDRPESYSLYDLNGNLEHSFTKYVTWNGTEPSAPGDPNNPASFSKSNNPMSATWIGRAHKYNLLNYTTAVETDAIATGSGILTLETEYFYNNEYNQITTQTPRGVNHTSVIDERGLVFQRKAAAGEAEEGVFETDFDDNGNLIASRDALGNETVYVLDGFDRVTKVTDPEGHYRTTEYDAASNVTNSKAYNVGNTLLSETQYTYDELNRVKQVRRLAKTHTDSNIGDGWADSFTALDKNSRVFASKDDNGVIFKRFYDGANRLIKTEDAVGNKVEYTLNAEGAMLETKFTDFNQVTMTANEVSHVYQSLDFMNRVVSFRDQRYHATNMDTEVFYHYDSASRTVRFLDAANTLTESEFDLISRTTRVTRSPGGGADDIVTMFAYDADSRNIERRILRNPLDDDDALVTAYQYDERDRLKKLIRPSSEEWTFSYNAQNRTGWTDPLGTTVSDTYDDRNLITERNISRGTGVVGPTKEEFAYDGLGRLATCSNHDGMTLISANIYEYNTLGLVESTDQTVASSAGNVLDTYTIKAAYDATGFRTSTVYWDDRTVSHTRDAVNRLQSSYDDTNMFSIASYSYAGSNRIVRRLYGNGTKTNYTYESAGCGCGGATRFVDRVEHALQSNSEVLFAVDRRYDVTGQLAVERFDHEGGLGVVYRRDNTYRLTDTYYGVDASGANINAFAVPGGTGSVPTSFGLHRKYTLDTRSNRSGGSAVRDRDDSGDIVYDYAYSLTTDGTDRYSEVDEDDYNYDLNEQRTYDDATGLHYAYDYRGRLWLVDINSNLATPEQVYHHDALGNRILEEGWYDGSPRTNVHKTVLINDIRSGGGCGAASGETKAGEIRYDGSDDEIGNVQYVYGNGMGSLVHELATNGTTTVHRFRHEDQAGSLIGVTDENGHRTDEYFYLDFGTPVHRPIAFDGNSTRISGVQANTPVNGVTRVTLSGVSFSSGQFNGKQARVIGSLLIGEVVGTGSTTIDIADPREDGTGSLYSHLNAGTGFVVLDFESPRPPEQASGVFGSVWFEEEAGGAIFEDEEATFTETVEAGDLVNPSSLRPDLWLEVAVVLSDTRLLVGASEQETDEYGELVAAGGGYEVQPASHWSYDPIADTSTYTNANANFQNFMAGWLFTPNVHKPSYMQVVAVDPNAGSITVKGDARSLEVTPVDNWRIHAPPCVDSATGGRVIDGPFEGSRYIGFGIRYIPPQAGFVVLGSLNGSQPGNNLAGHYYAHQHRYDPSICEWTTPATSDSQWTNLLNLTTTPVSLPAFQDDPGKPPAERSPCDLDALKKKVTQSNDDLKIEYKHDSKPEDRSKSQKELKEMAQQAGHHGTPLGYYKFDITVDLVPAYDWIEDDCCCVWIHKITATLEDTIYIASGLSKEQIEKTRWHEQWHRKDMVAIFEGKPFRNAIDTLKKFDKNSPTCARLDHEACIKFRDKKADEWEEVIKGAIAAAETAQAKKASEFHKNEDDLWKKHQEDKKK